MVVVIEFISDLQVRLVGFTDSQWQHKKGSFTSLQESAKVKVLQVESFEDARGLVVPRQPFKEYINQDNKFDIIIEVFEPRELKFGPTSL